MPYNFIKKENTVDGKVVVICGIKELLKLNLVGTNKKYSQIWIAI